MGRRGSESAGSCWERPRGVSPEPCAVTVPGALAVGAPPPPRGARPTFAHRPSWRPRPMRKGRSGAARLERGLPQGESGDFLSPARPPPPPRRETPSPKYSRGPRGQRCQARFFSSFLLAPREGTRKPPGSLSSPKLDLGGRPCRLVVLQPAAPAACRLQSTPSPRARSLCAAPLTSPTVRRRLTHVRSGRARTLETFWARRRRWRRSRSPAPHAAVVGGDRQLLGTSMILNLPDRT